MPRLPMSAAAAPLALALPLALAPAAAGQDVIYYSDALVSPAPAGPSTGETFIQSANVGVLISPDGSKIWGYSAEAGGLTPLPVDVPEEERGEVRPVVSGNVAMVVVGDAVYAYGGESGEWGSHPVGGREDARPIVGQNVAAIRVADGVYAFSGLAGAGGLHPLAEDEQSDGPAVGAGYVKVASDKGFGMFSAKTGTWGSVKYPAPPAEPAAPAGGAAAAEDAAAGAAAAAEAVVDAVEDVAEEIGEAARAADPAAEETATEEPPAAAEPAPAPPEDGTK